MLTPYINATTYKMYTTTLIKHFTWIAFAANNVKYKQPNTNAKPQPQTVTDNKRRTVLHAAFRCYHLSVIFNLTARSATVNTKAVSFVVC